MSASGVEIIATERKRQIEAEGWSARHDDRHINREMALAAAAYALSSVGTQDTLGLAERLWPWSYSWWKRGGQIRDLARAGALIAAEIDRILRAGEEVGE